MANRLLTVMKPAMIVLLFSGTLSLYAAEPERSPEEWLDLYSEGWKEADWSQRSRFTPNGYMRTLDDKGWKVRMQALHGLVSHGEEAIPTLLDTLKTGDEPSRILAAQALSYLAPHAPNEPLLEAARSDNSDAVRLYAIDALGMRGGEDVDWGTLQSGEKNRDARKHIGYAKERGGKAVEPEIVKSLTTWYPKTMDSAEVNQPAPDFTLQAATGETITLSDYRGKKAVVLVFIYGDT